MAQVIKNADIWGRVGEGFGKGLYEQLPKEMERSRLQSGLQNLENQKDLTPFQQFSRLSGLPGITPQMIQSGTELLRQQGIGQGLQQVGKAPAEQKIPSPLERYAGQGQQPNEKQGVTTPESTRATIENYIPKDREGLLRRAGELQKENPQLYPTPQDAIAGAQQEDQSNLARSQALQAQGQAQKGVQRDVENALEQQKDRHGANVPGNIYENIRQDALEDVRNGETEEQATRKAGKKMDEISRNISNVNSWGNVSLVTNKPSELQSAIKSVQKEFKKLGYQRELADYMIGQNGFSVPFAYAQANPVSDTPELNNVLKGLPNIKPQMKKLAGAGPGLAGIGPIGAGSAKRQEATQKVIPELAKSLGKTGSPMSVSYELEKKGYDTQLWKDYLVRNQDRLDLTKGQIEELGKTDKSFMSWLNDWWLKSFSGIE